MKAGSLRVRKHERTRAQIADAATLCFRKQGYDSTTLDDVAELAEVHKRTLLRYFPTKAHLVLHPFYAALEHFKEAVDRRGDRPVVEVWEEHVLYYRRRAAENRLLDIREIATREPSVGPNILVVQMEYKEILAKELWEEMGRNAASEIAAKVAAAGLVIGSFSVGEALIRRRAYDELEDAEREVIRLVRESFLKSAGAANRAVLNNRRPRSRAEK